MANSQRGTDLETEAARQPADIIQNALMSEGTVDSNMGKYHNDMD